jgi:ABC-2 type transport system permease protein
MWNAIRLYRHYAGVSVRSQLQYRSSFIMLAVGHFITTGGEFLALWALFDRFGNLRGWQLPEIALLYGVVSVAFAVAEGLARGFDTFAQLVRTGDFDRLLLRPRSTALQVAGRDLDLFRVGRLSQGLVILVWAGSALALPWTPARLALIVAAIAGGVCLFCGLFVVEATCCFWTTETLEVFATVTYGGVEAGQFPLTIYQGWFRKFFIYVVPLSAVTYFPLVAILGRSDPLGTSRLFQSLAPLLGGVFLAVALHVWEFGVRHYRSTGS